MNIDKNSSVAELRSELDRKRRNALDLQMNTTDPGDWNNLNTIRWELEDLDNDLYLSSFIRNNEKLEKLIGQIEEASEGAKKIVETLNSIKNAVQKARSALKTTSAMFTDINTFYKEIEALIEIFRS